jgi:hypothetical protein
MTGSEVELSELGFVMEWAIVDDEYPKRVLAELELSLERLIEK